MILTRTRLGAITALTGASLVLTGCGPTLAGSAAVVGTARITDGTVSQQVDELLAAKPTGDTAKVTQDTVRRLVIDELVRQEAARLGVVVSQGAVDKALATALANSGGAAALASAAVSSGIPPSQINYEITTSLLVTACATHLAPAQNQTQQQSALVQDVTKLATELDTRVSPRYGVWDPKSLALNPPADPFLVANGNSATGG